MRHLRDFKIELALLALLVALGAAIHASNRAVEIHVRAERPDGQVGALPDGQALRVLSLGFDRLVADLFWLRTIYYMGDEHSAAAGYPDAARLANLVTDIDPGFRTVYIVMSGAIGALMGDPDAAIALLEKGVQHVEYWKLHFLLGFNYFIERMDYARAAEQMKLGAEKGGPPYLPLLSARLYAQAGDPETAIAFIKVRLAETEHEETRLALEKRYWDLWITRDLAAINRAIEAYRRVHGAEPVDLAALLGTSLLERELKDPRGGAYRIEEGRAATDLSYARLEVHRAHAPTKGQIERDYQQMKQEQDGGTP
jgi:hypothetical protein